MPSTPLVTLAEELTFLDDYLAIESVRFEGRITVSVRADDDTLEALVPSFLLQPLVENAIRHGVGPRLVGRARRRDRVARRRCCACGCGDDGLGLSPDWTHSPRRRRRPAQHRGAARAPLSGATPAPRDASPSGVGGGVEVRLELPWRQSSAPPAVAGAPHD